MVNINTYVKPIQLGRGRRLRLAGEMQRVARLHVAYRRRLLGEMRRRCFQWAILVPIVAERVGLFVCQMERDGLVSYRVGRADTFALG